MINFKHEISSKFVILYHILKLYGLYVNSDEDTSKNKAVYRWETCLYLIFSAS